VEVCEAVVAPEITACQKLKGTTMNIQDFFGWSLLLGFGQLVVLVMILWGVWNVKYEIKQKK
jgi:hypothetical protein